MEEPMIQLRTKKKTDILLESNLRKELKMIV